MRHEKMADSTSSSGLPLIERVQARFESGKLLVNSGLLKEKGVDLVAAKLTRVNRRSGRAVVWAMPKQSALEPAQVLWDRLRFNDRTDLLILFNGQDWWIRGWGLAETTIAEALLRADRGLSVNWAHGLLSVITDLEVAVFESSSKAPQSSQASLNPSLIPLVGAAGVSAGLAIFWIIRRRQRFLKTETVDHGSPRAQ
jgi:hypothetical protein